MCVSDLLLQTHRTTRIVDRVEICYTGREGRVGDNKGQHTYHSLFFFFFVLSFFFLFLLSFSFFQIFGWVNARLPERGRRACLRG